MKEDLKELPQSDWVIERFEGRLFASIHSYGGYRYWIELSPVPSAGKSSTVSPTLGRGSAVSRYA